MRRFEFAEALTELQESGLHGSPGDKKLDAIVESWHAEFEGVDIDLFEYAVRRYKRENDYFPTLRKLIAAVSGARKSYKPEGGGGFYFHSEKEAEEIVWGIQLTEDVQSGVDKSEQLRARKERQLKAGIDRLIEITPGLSEKQRNRMIKRIAATNTEPIKSNQSYRDYLWGLASEIEADPI